MIFGILGKHLGKNGENMNIFITGNLGYNGCILVRELKERGHFVVGYDSGYFVNASFFGLREYLPDIQIMKDIRSISADDLKKYNIEKIVHLSALSNDPLGDISSGLTMEINFNSTKNLVKIAKELGISHLLYASSASVYGRLPEGKTATETTEVSPLTAYAISKRESENFLKKEQDGKFKVSLMRYSTMFGSSPMLRLDLVVNNLSAGAFLYNTVKILSDGTPWRPIIHVNDYARITSTFLENGIYGLYNVGFEELNVQVKDIGARISEITGAKLQINPEKTPDERSYKVDFSKISESFDAPSVNLNRGIAELIEDFKKYKLTKEQLEEGKFTRLAFLKALIKQGIINNEFFYGK